MLLSPVGIEEDPALNTPPVGMVESFGANWAQTQYPKLTATPQDFYRTIGYKLSYKSILGNMNDRVNARTMWASEIEKDAFTKYSVQIQVARKCTEIWVNKILRPSNPPAFSYKPLCHKLAMNLQIPICIMYGD